jgi:5-formyltetrahydrofolate cyclo-ligase
VAFDTAMNRIGYGVGYFDRFLKQTNAYKIGICYDMQIVPKIDAEPYDIAMNMLVTERRVIGPY